MEKVKIELTKLIATDGMTLTNGIAFGKEILLGTGDKEENWYEITDEEARKIQDEIEENIKNQAI